MKGRDETMNPISTVKELELAHGVTWYELAGLEPRLEELLWQARAAGSRCREWEDVRGAFAPFRGALAELVGFQGRHRNCRVLGSVGAYEVAYWRLYDAVAGFLPRPVEVRDAQKDPEEALAQVAGTGRHASNGTPASACLPTSKSSPAASSGRSDYSDRDMLPSVGPVAYPIDSGMSPYQGNPS
jgi:hypothetical protein